MNRKRLSLLLAIVVAVSLQSFVIAQSEMTAEDFDQIADRIITGQISEKKFRKMKLSDVEKLEVFKRIREKRDWAIDDDTLADVVRDAGSISDSTGDAFEALAASCSQSVELENGSSYVAYPYAQVRPNRGECGSDSDDVVLLYNTPKGRSANPNNIRTWSNLWWVRWVISSAYRGRVAANSLCTITTRVCIGSAGRALGNDLNYLYLWHK